MSTVRELRGITPLFQQVLSKQASYIMDALNQWRLEAAFQGLQTLIDCLRAKDADPFLENDLPHMEELLKNTKGIHGTNIFQTNFVRRKEGLVVLRDNLRTLFRKVMRVLHEGGYLELRLQPRFDKTKKLDVKTLEA